MNPEKRAKIEERRKRQAERPIEQPLHKYDGPHMLDPLVRCTDCARLVAVPFIHMHAGCNKCGNKRFKLIYMITEEEMAALKDGAYDLGLKNYEIDPEYLAIFEGVET